MADLVVILALAPLLTMAFITLLNAVTFTRLGGGQTPTAEASRPMVSVLVPARNEGRVIHRTLLALLAQEYPHYEVILLDDHSQDGTAQIAAQAAGADPRLKILPGRDLPPGWTGKNWACWQLAECAQGELLVFTDADVYWAPGALSSLVDRMAERRADVFTVWPTQETITWAERLVIPMMMFAVLAYLPEIAQRFTSFASLAAANGQCLAFRRAAYEQTGGHKAVAAQVVEDVSLARLALRQRLRLVMALGADQISGRMYHNWREVRQGFAKNILAGHAGRPLYLFASALFHWLLFLLPWLWLVLGWLVRLPWWPELPLAMVALGWGIRSLSAAVSNLKVRDAFLLPLSVVLMTVIAAQAMWWHYRYGGPLWKGRRLAAG